MIGPRMYLAAVSCHPPPPRTAPSPDCHDDGCAAGCASQEIKAETVKDIQKEQALAHKIQITKRRQTLAAIAAFIMASFLGLSVAANFAVTEVTCAYCAYRAYCATLAHVPPGHRRPQDCVRTHCRRSPDAPPTALDSDEPLVALG